MKVGEQLIYLACLRDMSVKDAKAKMYEWFERFNIMDWEHKLVEELSKGMQQKLQFISTVIHEPSFLILDEPFSGLDPVNANRIRERYSDSTVREPLYYFLRTEWSRLKKSVNKSY